MLAVPLCVADLRQTLADLGDGCRCVQSSSVVCGRIAADLDKPGARMPVCTGRMGARPSAAIFKGVLAPLLRAISARIPRQGSSISELAPARHGQSLLGYIAYDDHTSHGLGTSHFFT